MKRLFLLLIAVVFTFVGCKGNDTKKSDEKATNKEAAQTTETKEDKGTEKKEAELEKIVLGVSPVPHEEITEALKDEFKKAGLEVEVKVFDDYVQPNLALDQGDLDANFFQHEPYLQNFCKERNLDLVSIGKVHIEPIGIYSDKIKSLDELKEGDSVLIPSDPTNGRRSLLLLEKAGLITLEDDTKEDITEKDIKDNFKNLKFQAADPANIANLYKDVTIAAINTNFALGVGLTPAKDALFLEDKDSPYANIIAVKKGNETQEKFKKLIQVFNSEACKKFIEEKYNGEIYPAF